MEKQKKHQVNYSRAKDSNSTCGGCSHYLGGACEMVEGQISAGYWCRLHEHIPDLQQESKRYGPLI